METKVGAKSYFSKHGYGGSDIIFNRIYNSRGLSKGPCWFRCVHCSFKHKEHRTKSFYCNTWAAAERHLQKHQDAGDQLSATLLEMFRDDKQKATRPDPSYASEEFYGPKSAKQLLSPAQTRRRQNGMDRAKREFKNRKRNKRNASATGRNS